MKIYSPHPKAYTKVSRRFAETKQIIYVTPGRTNPTSEFMENNEDGKPVPKQFKVEFINGEADVPDNLAKWMIDKGHALKSKKDKRLIKLLGEPEDD